MILKIQRQVVLGESREKTGIRGTMFPDVLFAVYDKITRRAEYIPPMSDDIMPLLKELINLMYYDGRDNPPHPEMWFNYFLKMVELHAKKVVELASASVKEQSAAAMSFLNAKEKNFLQYLTDNHVVAFTPVEMAEKLSVSNRTIINWCLSLAKNGFLVPNLVKQRIRSYTVTGFGV